MANLQEYWQKVRELERSLPKFVWLTSLEDLQRGMVGGRIAEVAAAQAAQLLIAGMHRRSSEDEIAAHLNKEEEARRRGLQEGLRRRGIAVVPVPILETPAEDGKRAPARRR
jgi:hypothetical protein